MNERTKGSALIVAAALMWSTGGILMKVIPWNPVMINGVRCIIAFFFVCLLDRTVRIRINRYIVLTAFCIAMTTMLFSMANKLTTAANAIVLQYTSPIFVLIISCFEKRRRPSAKQAGVVLVAFAGIVLFFCDQLDTGHMIGNFLAILSGITYSGVFFFNSRPESSNDDSLRLACLISFGIFAATIPFQQYFPAAFDGKIAAAVLVLGIVQIGLAYYAFGRGLKRIDPVIASLLGLFEALFNPLWVALFLGELPGFYALIGAILIIAAVAYNIVFVPEERASCTSAGQKQSI